MELKVLFAARELFHVPYESYFFAKFYFAVESFKFHIDRKLFEHTKESLKLNGK